MTKSILPRLFPRFPHRLPAHVLATIPLLASAILLLTADTATACPGCKDAIAGNSGGGDTVSGYFWSILFMMSMPFTIFASLGTYFFLLVRRARSQASNLPNVPPAPHSLPSAPAGEALAVSSATSSSESSRASVTAKPATSAAGC